MNILPRLVLALIGAGAAPVLAADATDIQALQAENAQLRSLVPSQSHAMMDVAYHFTNLWFAGRNQNWPLAQFYLNETRSHIRWAIRLVPVRKVSSGELRLQDIYDAFDKSLLVPLNDRIGAKDRKGFDAAYRAALGGCNGCHVAAEKPFLHVGVPHRPEQQIVDFAPRK
jgi:hypothetical protein